ncbi:MAG: LysM peptidoglycan-binding domain-containing M23 family metallopeptidase, partial [Pseudolabrys sp.]|nr:LysM peptidoglycan-binding domain-containing M23 family metallopeptidase [Pseudolabrys sp.]
ATVAANTSNGGYASGGQGLGAYRPSSSRGSSDITGSVSAPAKPAGHWTWDGGAPVTVGYGENVDMIARKYHVPTAAILQTNGITNAATVRPGQRLVIPRYVLNAAPQAPAAPRIAAPAYVPSAPAVAENVHVVAPGESLIGIARRNRLSLSTLARANKISPYTKLNIGDRIAIPGGRQVAARPAPAKVHAAAPPVVSAPRQAQPRIVTADKVASVQTQSARMATEAPATTETATSQAKPAGELPTFRWPVHGRIIAAFGSRPNGVQNDGINLAVPEGTPIKAADDGVVAYAGNELKGYGNLVLIRHANGYVSAYANASQLLVKRGDSIKRGQVIAHAGQTGNVSSPQLHFEIRKGSTPVDPTKYLSGA